MKEYEIFNPVEIAADSALGITLNTHHCLNGLKKWKFCCMGVTSSLNNPF